MCEDRGIGLCPKTSGLSNTDLSVCLIYRPGATQRFSDAHLLCFKCVKYVNKAIGLCLPWNFRCSNFDIWICLIYQIIEAEWRIYVSTNKAVIGLSKGFAHVRRQAIIWTNEGSLSIRPNETSFIETLIEIQHFDLALEYVVCKLAAISC